jgi:hypothetical protein
LEKAKNKRPEWFDPKKFGKMEMGLKMVLKMVLPEE